MKLQSQKSIYEYFNELEDPRVDRTKRHKLIDIITITICAVICGADTWVDIEAYGQSKHQWLKEFERTTKWNSFSRYICSSFCQFRYRTITKVFFVMDSVNYGMLPVTALSGVMRYTLFSDRIQQVKN